MAKKKRKPKLTCQYDHIFGQDGFNHKECDKCSIARACGDASYYYEQKRKEERRKERREERRKKKQQRVKEDKPKKKRHSKKTAKPKKKLDLERDHRSLLIPPELLQKMMDLPMPHSSNCIAMYNFVLKEGIRQKTNRPYCTDNFISGKKEKGKKRKGLKWDIGRVRNTKWWLINKVECLKEIQERDEKTGHFKKKYLEIIYYPSKFVIENEECLHQLDQDVEDFVEWCNTFTSQHTKDEIEIVKQRKRARKWKRKYGELKKNT